MARRTRFLVPVAEIGLTPRVLDVFRSADSTPTLATVGDRIVVVSARHVAREGRDLGTVLVVRDRTDVESLTRQLDAVQLMSTVLRAQRHEFANRLHLLNGLLQSGHLEEAAQYVEELLGSGPLGSAIPGIDAIRDAFLQAFLAAKSASAREAGVTLTIGENSLGPDHPTVAIRLSNLAALLHDMDRLADAEPLYRRALAISEKSLRPGDPGVAKDLYNLAALLWKTNRLAEAEPLLRRALGILVNFTHTAGHQHPRLESVHANYAQAIKELGKSEAYIDAALKSAQEAPP